METCVVALVTDRKFTFKDIFTKPLYFDIVWNLCKLLFSEFLRPPKHLLVFMKIPNINQIVDQYVEKERIVVKTKIHHHQQTIMDVVEELPKKVDVARPKKFQPAKRTHILELTLLVNICTI